MQFANSKSDPVERPWLFEHPISPIDAAAMAALRAAVGDMKGKLEGVSARAPFNGFMEHVAAPEGVTFEADTVGGVQLGNSFGVPQLRGTYCKSRWSGCIHR